MPRLCRECGFTNDDGVTFCQACAAPFAATPQDKMRIQYGRYNDIKAAVEAVQAGSLPADTLGSLLDAQQESLQRKLEQIYQAIETYSYDINHPEEVQCGLEGFDLFLQGIEEMRLYVSDCDFLHLQQGLQMAWDGNQKLLAAAEMNRESRRHLAEQWDASQDTLEHLRRRYDLGG